MKAPFPLALCGAAILTAGLMPLPAFADSWHVSATASPAAYTQDTRYVLLAITDDTGKPVAGLHATSFEALAFACGGSECAFRKPASVAMHEDFVGLYILTVKKDSIGGNLGPVAVRIGTSINPAQIAGGGKAPPMEQRELVFIIAP